MVDLEINIYIIIDLKMIYGNVRPGDDPDDLIV